MRIREFGKALSVKDLPLLPVTRWLASIVLLAIPASVFAEVVQYEVTFDSLWTAETHPIDYPSGAHYSAHIGATHNADYTLWGPGEISTEGMKNLAELGTGSPGDAEIEAAIEARRRHFPGFGNGVDVGSRQWFLISPAHDGAADADLSMEATAKG